MLIKNQPISILTSKSLQQLQALQIGYRNRRVSEETFGITLPTSHSQSVERHEKYVTEAPAL